MSNYWTECISEAFEDAGIVATSSQIETVASWVEGSHDNYGMAHGHDCIPDPLSNENKRLKRELKKERDSTVCGACKGKGFLVENLGFRSSTSECYRCRGEGRV